MKYVISTQYLENYGLHDYDSDGKYPEGHYWKFKGGTDYIVTGFGNLADAVAYVQATLHEFGNTLGTKEFPRVWRTFEKWEEELLGFELEDRESVRENARRLDPRGQAVIDLMDRVASTDTTHP